MRRTFSRPLTSSLLLALLIVATACQPTPTPTVSATPAGGLGGPQEGADPAGELVTNIYHEPSTIDPHKAPSVPELEVVRSVFENLMAFDAVTLAPVPAAAAAPPEISSDGKRFVFTLREGLKYSDGTPLNAQDFEYGYARTCDPRTAAPNSSLLYVIVGCEDWNRMSPGAPAADLDAARARLGVRALDARRIEFTTIEPAPYFPTLTTGSAGLPVRRADVEAGDAWLEPPAYIGNGPFRLVEWKHNQSITLERNEHYHRPAKLKTWRLLMIGVTESAVEFAAYRNNQLDVMLLDPEDIRTVQADRALRAQVVNLPAGGMSVLGLNTTKPPFDDPKVRLAFAKSLDREAFVRDLLSGAGAPARGFIPVGQPGYDPSDDVQSFNVSAARQALAESSYGTPAALPRISFAFMSLARDRTRAEWAQEQWRTNLGVEVELEPVDGLSFQRLIIDPATAPQIFSTGWGGSQHQRNWLSLVWGTGGSLASRTGYSSSEFDRLVTAADTTLDPERAAELYREAGRLLSRDAPAIWEHAGQRQALVKPWVRGYQPTVIGLALNKHEIYVVKR